MKNDTLTKRNEDRVHYVYKITNLMDGKYYIGVHSLNKSPNTTPLTDNYWGSGTLIHLIIKELGKANFKKEIISICDTREQSLALEEKLVSLDTLNDPLCYNLALGGTSFKKGSIPVYTKNKDKIIFLPQKVARENELSIVQDNPVYLFNKKSNTITISNDVNNLGEDIKLLRPVLTNGDSKRRDKLISRLKGKVLAVRTGDNTRAAVLLEKDDPRLLSGEFVGFTKGLKLSEEAREKKRGNNNPSYNTVWITDGKLNKKIEKCQSLDLPEGWALGRTLSTKNKQNIAESNSQRAERERTLVTIKNLNTGKEESVRLDRVFFKNDELITAEMLQSLYEPVNNWEKVSNALDICIESLRKVRNFYISLGYKFSSNTKIRRPRRQGISTTRGKIIMHKGKIMKYINKNDVSLFVQDGWELGMAK